MGLHRRNKKVHCILVVIEKYREAASMNKISVVSAMVIGLSLSVCGSHQTAQVSKPTEKKIAGDLKGPKETPDERKGLSMTLRELPIAPDRGEIVAATQAIPLSMDKTRTLINRLPQLETGSEDVPAFSFRPSSAPPPRPGVTVQATFPQTEVSTPPSQVNKSDALKVVRFAPEGRVDMAPYVTVSFSKPMVPITSAEEAAASPPIEITPLPKGKWRALGTQTFLFAPEGRFPMATQYRVTIPKETTSIDGDSLKSSTTFSFQTPPLVIEEAYPDSAEPQGLSPAIFMRFNQQIDPVEVMKSLSLFSAETKVPVVLLSLTELPRAMPDGTDLRARAEAAKTNTWIAFQPERPLEKDSVVRVVLNKGAQSKEGPLKTKEPQEFGFHTFASLNVESHRCEWGDECPPSSGWTVDFNNPLDLDALDRKSIAVEPPVDGLQIDAWYRSIRISGTKDANTTYKVTLPAAIKDSFGQTLGEDARLTFKVGPAEKQLFGFEQEMVTLDPSGDPVLTVFSRELESLKCEIHQVEPVDLRKTQEAYFKRMQSRNANAPFITLPGKTLFDGVVPVSGPLGRLNKTPIDFTPYLNGGFGQFLVRVSPGNKKDDKELGSPEYTAWVQVTNIGITAFIDNQEMVAWTTALDRAAPIKDATISLLGKKGDIQTISDGSGLSRINLPEAAEPGDILVARNGADVAVLPYSVGLRWTDVEGGWRKIETKDELRWFTFDDRGMYRPGETASVKGWIRRFDSKKMGDLHSLNPMPSKVTWRLFDSLGNELSSGEAKVSHLGGFDISCLLPNDMNLGSANLVIAAKEAGGLEGIEHYHNLRVEEFRRPEFEVTSTADAGPFVIGDEAKVTVSASYYAGGGLPMAKVTWTAFATPAFYTPPGHDEYQFGPWNPWWFAFSQETDTTTSRTLHSKTDGAGMHRIGISFDRMNPFRPMSVRVEGQVTDVNQQTWTSMQTLLVHPSDRYVGIRLGRGFVGRGEPIDASVIVSDIDGKNIVGAKPRVTLSRVESSYRNNAFKETFEDEGTCELVTEEKPSACVFQPKKPGVYRLTGEVRDEKGRLNVTEVRVWVEGAEVPRNDSLELEKIVLIPEKQSYQPGETASFLVETPIYPAEGVLTVRNGGLADTRAFRMEGPTKVLTVPVLEAYLQGFGVEVDLTGAKPLEGRGKGAGMRPAFASGSLHFQVPPLKRTLGVSLSVTDKVLAPGGKTTIDLRVKDAMGKSVEGAELAVLVVDESVLALSGYSLPDPISVFYQAKGDRVEAQYSRYQIRLSKPPAAAPAGGGRGMAMPVLAPPPAPPFEDGGERVYKDGGGNKFKKRLSAPMTFAAAPAADGSGAANAPSAPVIAARTNFDATALFVPEVTTDKAGRASVPLTLPDSLTRYRVMVVAAAKDTFFGASETTVTARLPLMVRPSPPRFLNFGDEFELEVVLQNQTDKPITAEVAVRASNAVLSKKGETEAGKKITVPANNRVEVRFYAAPKNAGIARFQIVSLSGDFSDAQTISVPVRTPATAEAFATYGELDDGAVLQSLRAPKEIFKEFGGLSINVSSTELQSLSDAVLYLTTYPFECAEQISSRVLAVAALKDVLTAFAAEGLPSADALTKSVSDDLRTLGKIQNWDGGFGFWNRGEQSLPYLTVHAAHAMAEAKAKGVAVDPSMWERAFSYLVDIRSRMPNWYSEEARFFIRGYAVDTMEKMGGNPLSEALALVADARDKLPLEAAAWVLPTLVRGKKKDLVDSILRRFDNAVTETAGAAHFVTSYTDGKQVLLHSDRRADGILLGALIEVDPKSDLIPKLVRGLLGHTTKGRWMSTQENAFVLLALDRYFSVFEKSTPDFTASAWVGGKLALEHLFQGRNTKRVFVDIPMDLAFGDKESSPLIVDKKGAGRLYYRLGLRYAPKSLVLKPFDNGFTVDRAYEGLDSPDDVKKDEKGVWHIKRGSRVRVRLSMVAQSRRYHAALVDPLPAGLEPINPTLAVEGSIPDDPKAQKASYWWWYRPWFEHQNLRDDRVEAFTSLLWEGVHEYTYQARATTPGTFVVPPARAEEMYSPETFGRTGTDKVVVE
jgi:uncharacterized protein YfaS (alpha-2-macroglobulin family)